MKKRFLTVVILIVLVLIVGGSYISNLNLNNNSNNIELIGFLRGVYFERSQPLLVFDDATILFKNCSGDCSAQTGIKNISLNSIIRFESKTFSEGKIVRLSPNQLKNIIKDNGQLIQQIAFVVTLNNQRIVNVKEVSD